MLLYIIISFHGVRKYFPEVGMIEWIYQYSSLTNEVSIPKSHINVWIKRFANEPYWIVSSALKELHWFVSQMVREWALLSCQFSPEKAPLICESNGSWMMSIQSFVNELYCIAISVIREWAFLNCYFKRSRTNSTELSL